MPSPKGNAIELKEHPRLAVNSYSEFLQQYKLTNRNTTTMKLHMQKLYVPGFHLGVIKVFKAG